MAAPVQVDADKQFAIQAGGTSIVITKPTNLADGDVLYASVARDESNAVDAITVPSGWTPLPINNGSFTCGFYRKVIVTASGEPADYTWSWTNSEKAVGWIIRVTGADNTTPEDAGPIQNTGNSVAPRCLSRTTVTADTLILAIGGASDKVANDWTPPTSMAEVFDLVSTGGGAAASHATASLAEVNQAGIGATGDKDFARTSAKEWVCFLVAIRPAAADDNNVSELPSIAITVTPFVPTVEAFQSQISQLPSLTITVTPFVPTVDDGLSANNISELPSQAITVTPFVPTVVSTDFNISELPSQAITVTPFVPTVVSTDFNISELPSQAITVTLFVPTVVSTDFNTSQLPSQTITVTPFVPTVVVADNQISELPSQAITLVPQVPDAVTTEFASPTVCRVSFPTPTLPPLDGVGLQIFRWFLRKDAAHVGGTGTPTAAFFLYEAGVQRQVLTAGVSITSDSGQLVEVTWNSVNLTAGNGADVEARMVTTVGGSGSNARTIEVGAVEWCSDPDTADNNNTSQLPSIAIAVTPFVPTVVSTDFNISELPSQVITVTPFVPSVVSTEFNISSLPSIAITVTPFVPIVEAFQSQISQLPSIAITVTPFVPIVEAFQSQISQLPSIAITVTPFVPLVSTSADNTSQLPSQVITVTPFVPSVVSTEFNVSQLSSVAITLTPFVPQVTTGDPQISQLPAHTITLVPKVPVIIVATPCDEVLPPNVLLEQINATGSLADIDESVADPDDNWLVSP